MTTTKLTNPGQRVYISFGRGVYADREYATIVTGTIVDHRREGVGDPEPHVLIEFEDGGLRVWEPTRKLKIARARA